MSRLERLLNLLALLLESPRPLTRADIRDRIPGYGETDESFRRAFERDKQTLRDMGVPLVLSEVPGAEEHREEGYRVDRERYELPDPGLEPDELAALRLAAARVRLGTEPDEGGDAALRKLGAAPAVDADEPAAEVPAAPGLVELYAAIADRCLARFGYRGVDREVEPRRLRFQQGHWYLDAHDRTRAGEERHFRLDRIEGAITRGDPDAFSPRPLSPVRWFRPWELGDDPPVTARVLVDALHAGWAAEQAGEGAVVERRPDGGVVLELAVTNTDGLRAWLMGFLEHAEVLEPPEVRAVVVGWLEALCRG